MNKKYYKRLFLNKKEGTAFLELSYEDGYGNIKISDCNKSISLSIDTSNKKERENSLYKIDLILLELSKYKAKLELQ